MPDEHKQPVKPIDRIDKQDIQDPKIFKAYKERTPQPASMILVVFLLILSLAVRLYKITNPNEIVFDEVHFGKFASNYLNSKFFFDVHPPVQFHLTCSWVNYYWQPLESLQITMESLYFRVLVFHLKMCHLEKCAVFALH